jgi:hypothetical protein
MKATSLCAAALLVGSTMCGYAAEGKVGDTLTRSRRPLE